MIHNPDAKRAPDGTFVMFYDGSSTPPPNGAASDSSKVDINPIILRQNIGLATASSPAGPWTRRDRPILEPTGVNGTWDQLFVTNPAGCASRHRHRATQPTKARSPILGLLDLPRHPTYDMTKA